MPTPIEIAQSVIKGESSLDEWSAKLDRETYLKARIEYIKLTRGNRTAVVDKSRSEKMKAAWAKRKAAGGIKTPVSVVSPKLPLDELIDKHTRILGALNTLKELL